MLCRDAPCIWPKVLHGASRRVTPQPHHAAHPRTVPQLRGTGQEPSLALLELFAYGSYPEYKAAVASLPKLNPQQLKKLR